MWNLLSYLVFVILTTAVATTVYGKPDVTELVNIEGKKIKVKLIDVEDGEVRFLLIGKKKVTKIPLDQLSEITQTKVKIWKQEGGNLSRDLRFHTCKVEKGDYEKSSGGGSKSRSYKVTVMMKIKNNDRHRASIAGSVVIYTNPPEYRFGNSAKIYQNLKFNSIPAGGSIELRSNPVTYSKNSYARIYTDSYGRMTTTVSESGSDYKDYGVYVLDESRQIVLEQGKNKKSLEFYRGRIEADFRREKFDQKRRGLIKKRPDLLNRSLEERFKQMTEHREKVNKQLESLKAVDPDKYKEQKAKMKVVRDKQDAYWLKQIEELKRGEPKRYETLMQLYINMQLLEVDGAPVEEPAKE